MKSEIQTRVKNARAYGRNALNANSANLGLKRVVAFEYHFDVLNNRSEIKKPWLPSNCLSDTLELEYQQLSMLSCTPISRCFNS